MIRNLHISYENKNVNTWFAALDYFNEDTTVVWYGLWNHGDVGIHQNDMLPNTIFFKKHYK